MRVNKRVKDVGYGDALAAKKNREFEARSLIVRALQELSIEPHRWPGYVQQWNTNASNEPKFSSSAIPPSFQPPTFERLRDSVADWKKQADLAWRQHRNRFLEQLAIGEQLGIDEKVPLSRKSRGSGRSARYSNVQERWKWAALRLLGHPWKQIAFDVSKTSAIRKAASQLLTTAAWPTKTPPRKHTNKKQT